MGIMSTSALRSRRALNLSVLCFSMIPLALGTSYDYGFDVTAAHKAKRQSGDIVVTTGMPLNNDGSVSIRPEIRTLEQDEDKWSLYILALDMLQYTDQSEPTSWFGLTGIHGVPFQPWNGVQPTPGNEDSGYCHHQDILFPTWHRVYVALYEQELCGRVQYISTLYSDDVRGRFEAAAADCRAPYFDWAATPSGGNNILPLSVGGSSSINISGPAGTQTIANPLYTYDFKPPDPSVFDGVSPWSDWDSTKRAPSSTSPDAESDNSNVNQELLTYMVSNQQRLYNLFSSYDNYTIVSNEGWAEDTSQYDSFESLHDNIHAMLGGFDGHMSIVPFSGFDPLFFLHHCMVDRLYALWQALNPDSWILPQAARENSYTTSVGDILDGSTDLTPFYAYSNGTFWNSDMLRDPAVLGYTYPEISEMSFSNRSSISAGRSGLISSITKLYGANSISRSSGRSGSSRIHSTTSQRNATGSSRRQPSASQPVDGLISDQGQYREWIANIRVQRHGLGPFSVNLDLADGCHVGTVGIFTSPPTLAGLMKMAPGSGYIASAVPLTKMLVDKVTDGTIASLNLEEVSNYLGSNLQVSGIKSDGTKLVPEEIPGLSIKIVSALVQAAASEEHLPTWESPDFEMDFF